METTIDEAIAFCNEKANNIKLKAEPQVFIQIAEWLEELKNYRDKNKMVVRVDVENMDSIKDKIDKLSKYAESQYNKAVDDFADKFISSCDDGVFMAQLNKLPATTILELAEQLKAGGKNER